MRLKGHYVNVDIPEELEQFEWEGARWTGSKLIAKSPFRPDLNPSFYVNLDGDAAGTWGDSGSGQRGGLLALLAELRGETTEEVADYLAAKYGMPTKPGEPIRIQAPKLDVRMPYYAPPESAATPAISPYLRTRDISDEVQRLFAVGYGEDKPGFTAIPWHTADGKLANVKYRSTRGKDFFYISGATPIAQLVYGLDVVNARGIEYAVLCEGEIDALSWWTAGVPAICVGSASISPQQADAIKRSSLRRLALGGDNDAAGKRLNERAEAQLRGSVRLMSVDYSPAKDANEVLSEYGRLSLRDKFDKFRVESSNIVFTGVGKSSKI